MRRAAVALTLATVLLGAAAAPAGAYRIGGRRWPGHTITYFDGGPNRGAVKLAVKAWNASGVRLRFKPVSRGRAQVRIVRLQGACYGFAQLGYAPTVHPALVRLARCTDQEAGTVVAAHELGHILGLAHETRHCADMNPVATGDCPQPKAWMTRCNPLERDDVLGAVRLYGGRARVKGRPFCQRFGPPAAPTGIALAVSRPGSGDTAIRTPVHLPKERMLVPGSGSGPYLSADVYRYPGACPDGPPQGKPLTSLEFQRGGESFPIDDRMDTGPGRFCYALWTRDALGRRSARPATAIADVALQPPSAAFDAPDAASTQETVWPQDLSQEGEAGIASWQWDFGDGSPPDGTPSPAHGYEQPGTYTITLTVADRFGQRSTATRQITVFAQPSE